MAWVSLPSPEGLDLGCGGPTLHLLFEDAGHSMKLCNHFYFPDDVVFTRQYDFITASKVVEHLFAPMEALNRLWGCLKTGGTLGVMTKFSSDNVAIETWHYKNDATHVCFFSTTTFNYLATLWNAEVTFGDDVAIFKNTYGSLPQ